MEDVVLHFKLMRGVWRTPLAYVVHHHIKVAHRKYGYSAYLNLDKDMITRVPIADAKLSKS